MGVRKAGGARRALAREVLLATFVWLAGQTACGAQEQMRILAASLSESGLVAVVRGPHVWPLSVTGELWVLDLAKREATSWLSEVKAVTPQWRPKRREVLVAGLSRGSLLLVREPPAEAIPIEGGPPYKLPQAGWSPSGEKLAYRAFTETSGPGLYIRDFKTGGDYLVARGARGGSIPRWSPDGRRVAFRDWDPVTQREWLVVLDLVTGRRRIVARPEGKGKDLYWVAWSPRGNLMAWAGRGWLGVLDTASWKARTLLSGRDAWLTPTRVWSPDGSRLACQILEQSAPQVWVINVSRVPAGRSGLHRLTMPPKAHCFVGWRDNQTLLVHDGYRILEVDVRTAHAKAVSPPDWP